MRVCCGKTTIFLRWTTKTHLAPCVLMLFHMDFVNVDNGDNYKLIVFDGLATIISIMFIVRL